MNPPRVALDTLKLAQLKRLAMFCGINNGGTKSQVAQRVTERLRGPDVQKPASSGRRILSIDMGIRNLAYCVLDVSPINVTETASLDTMLASTPDTIRRTFASVDIIAWSRTAVGSSPPSPSSGKQTAAKESFEPAVFARYAHYLVVDVFAPFMPATVLIERQRHRSGGASAVLEWTVRVNMLESMLHAVFYTRGKPSTLYRSGVGGDETQTRMRLAANPPQVLSVDPKKVANFWISHAPTAAAAAAADGERATSSSSKIEKEAKIALAESWLRASTPSNPDLAAPFAFATPETERVAAAFLAARERSASGRRRGSVSRSSRSSSSSSSSTEGAAEVGKLDDLADCLLQGAAWVQWEANARALKTLLDVG